MVSRFAPLSLVLLLVLAGCTGSVSPEAGTTPTSVTETTTTTATTTNDATATPTASSTTTRPAHATLDAADLTAFEREVLGRAVETGSVRVAQSNLTGQLTPDKDGWYVRFDGTLYKMSWQYGGFYGRYYLENATEVPASSVDSSDSVVAYENVTADARDLFDAARSGEESEAYDHDDFPDQFRENSYVRYGGDYYALEVVVADYIVYRISVLEVES
jgi:hypothetical protein